MSSREISLVAVADRCRGSTASIASTSVVLGVGVDLGDAADDEERQRQDREERQEPEVGHRAGLLAGLDLAVVLLHPHHVVDERAGARGAPRAVPSARPSRLTYRSIRRQREVAGRLPAAARRRARRDGSRRRRTRTRSRPAPSNARSSWAVAEVVGDGHVRVVREVQVDRQRPAAYGVGELLALGDALDQGHEHHRRDRPEGAGAAQVHRGTASTSAAAAARWSSIAAQLARRPRSAAPA